MLFLDHYGLKWRGSKFIPMAMKEGEERNRKTDLCDAFLRSVKYSVAVDGESVQKLSVDVNIDVVDP